MEINSNLFSKCIFLKPFSTKIRSYSRQKFETVEETLKTKLSWSPYDFLGVLDKFDTHT